MQAKPHALSGIQTQVDTDEVQHQIHELCVHTSAAVKGWCIGSRSTTCIHCNPQKFTGKHPCVLYANVHYTINSTQYCVRLTSKSTVRFDTALDHEDTPKAQHYVVQSFISRGTCIVPTGLNSSHCVSRLHVVNHLTDQAVSLQ